VEGSVRGGGLGGVRRPARCALPEAGPAGIARHAGTPPKQDDGGFAGLMRWASVVPAQDMAQLLEEEFFGKWQDALCRWLWAAKPTAGEAVAWHEGWKRLLTPELLAEERVRVPIEAGLQKISRAAQGLQICRRERDQHGSEAHSCRSTSRWRAVVGSGSNKRR
jgi:tuftelin-interacting protein 11